MSYTVASPGGKTRPATVSAASALLYLCALIELIALVLSFLAISKVSSVLTTEFANTPNADTVATAITIGSVVGAVVSGLFAIGTVVLGVLIGKGRNPARIVTWVLAGIGVLCNTCSLGSTAVSNSLNGLSGTADPQAEAIQRRMTEAIPGWQTAASTALTVIVLLALIAVIILLALPASNEFFRKEQEVWVPPTWPGAGGFPPVPPPAGPSAGPQYGPPGPGAPPTPPQG